MRVLADRGTLNWDTCAPADLASDTGDTTEDRTHASFRTSQYPRRNPHVAKPRLSLASVCCSLVAEIYRP